MSNRRLDRIEQDLQLSEAVRCALCGRGGFDSVRITVPNSEFKETQRRAIAEGRPPMRFEAIDYERCSFCQRPAETIYHVGGRDDGTSSES